MHHRGRARPHRPRRGHLARHWADAVPDGRLQPPLCAHGRCRATRHGRRAPLSIVPRVNAGRCLPESWIARAEEGGGHVVGEVCHFVDLCTHLADSSIAVSLGHTFGGGSRRRDDRLGMANGSMATVAYMIDGDRAGPRNASRCSAADASRRSTIFGVHASGGRGCHRGTGVCWRGRTRGTPRK